MKKIHIKKLNIKRIILLAAFIGSLLLLSGCGSKYLDAANAETTVTDFLEDYKDMDFDGMYAMTHDAHPYFDGLYIPQSESNVYMFKTLSYDLDYQITDISINKKEAAVTVHTSNINVENVLNAITEEYLEAVKNDPEGKTDVDKLFLDITQKHFDDPDNERIEKDTVFNLIEKDGHWTIESNIMIYDDITGGYMTFYYKNVVFKDLAQPN